MRTPALAAGIILGLAVSPCLGQAVAEGAMVHANSAAGTAKAGSALGNALSKAMSGNAEKMESLSAGKVEHVPHASGKSSSAPIGNSVQSSGPLVITSIRGAQKPCTAPTPQPANSSSMPIPTKADSPAQTQTAAAPVVPAARDCGTTTTQSSSKPVIKLAFPK